MQKLKILTFVGYYLPGYKGGGPIRTIKNMADQLSDEFEFWIITRDRDLGDSQSYESISVECWNKVGNCNVYYLAPTKNKFLKLRSLISNTRHDVLYLNGFFSFSYSIKPLLAYRTLKSNEQPVILAPRGGFSEGALKIKKLKKNAFIKLVRLLKIYRNIIFHASSNFEFDDILKTLITTKSFIKVAIDMPEMSKGGFKNYIPPSDKKSDLRLIFVSRISPKKNLDYALKVLSNIKCKVSFDIYGPLEDEDYWEDCRQLIKNLPENVECRYCGILMPEKVKIVFSGYDIFLFPTHGENYGHVIAESLSVGTPVLISDQTPWKCLDKEGLGWEFSLNDESSFIQVINQFAQTSAEERCDMRIDIQKKMEKRLSDPGIINANRSLFKNILNIGIRNNE